MLPAVFHDYFSLNSFYHSHDTRQASDFHIPSIRTTLRKQTIKIRGPLIWNSLSNDIKLALSINVLKKKLKAEMLFKYV